MVIAYDAKRYFHNKSGLGNYSREIVRLVQENSTYQTVLLDSVAPTADAGRAGIYKLLPSSFWRSYGVWKTVKRLKANVYHGLSNELPLGKAPKEVKVVVTIHDVIYKHYPEQYNPSDVKIYDFKTRKACEKADVIIAISPQTKADLMHFYQVPEEKIRIVYQPIASRFVKEPQEKDLADCRRKYNLPKDFYLYVSSFDERKNQTFLIETFKELSEGYLVLAGFKGKAFEQVKALVTKYNLEDKIFIVTDASTSDLHCLYHLCKTFVYPSLVEGFGIPILEALHSGKTVYCNGQENFKAMFGDACKYFDVNEVNTLIQLIESNEQVPQKARMECLKAFEEKKLARDLLKVYED